MSRPVFYEYWRSSAAYRVRIALHLKGVDYESRQIDLREGAQTTPDYLAANPFGLVPMLVIDGQRLTQSLAILNYLDMRYPNCPLIPAMAAERAHVVAMALAIACDIHPLNNLRVLKYLKNELKHSQDEVDNWYRHWIADGLAKLEADLARLGTGKFCHGDAPTLADCCLVPQIFNANRYNSDLAPYPTTMRVFENCMKLEAFERAQPAKQSDAE